MADKRREDDYTFKLLVEGPDDLFVIARLRELNHLADNIFIKPCPSVAFNSLNRRESNRIISYFD